MLERYHRSLKAAIRCQEKKRLPDCLPSVLFGFRSVLPEDLGSEEDGGRAGLWFTN